MDKLKPRFSGYNGRSSVDPPAGFSGRTTTSSPTETKQHSLLTTSPLTERQLELRPYPLVLVQSRRGHQKTAARRSKPRNGCSFRLRLKQVGCRITDSMKAGDVTAFSLWTGYAARKTFFVITDHD